MDHPVRGHDPHRVHRVAGQPELPSEHALAAAERQPRDPDARTGPAGDDQAARGELRVDVDELRARADARHGARPVERHRGHGPDVADQARAARVSAVAVAAAAGRERERVRPRERDGALHVRLRAAVGDALGLERVEARVEQPTRHRVALGIRTDQLPLEALGEPRPVRVRRRAGLGHRLARALDLRRRRLFHRRSARRRRVLLTAASQQRGGAQELEQLTSTHRGSVAQRAGPVRRRPTTGYTREVNARQHLHALVDDLDEDDLDLARAALREISEEVFDLSEDDVAALRERETECDRGEVVDANTFLRQLRGAVDHSEG